MYVAKYTHIIQNVTLPSFQQRWHCVFPSPLLVLLTLPSHWMHVPPAKNNDCVFCVMDKQPTYELCSSHKDNINVMSMWRVLVRANCVAVLHLKGLFQAS